SIITKLIKELIAFIDSLPSYIELDFQGKHYVMVHAGVDPELPIEECDEEILAWIREYFYFNEANPDYMYIFGHTPCCFINDDHSFDVWYDPDYHNKIGIDGGLAVGEKGQLNCLCLNDGSVTVIKYGEGQLK
ncbi:MAG: serine/threonine protein phosphatase, partial [Coprobacillus sp.]|nr:serine/threonine protein phosphatase [Coprobacillus sp.]